MVLAVKYPTRPLACWDKGKELRNEHYRQLSSAKEDGKLLISGTAMSNIALPAGIGDFVFFCGEPYAASVATDQDFSIQAMEAAESRGFARDMCAYMRNYWGSMFLNKFYFTGGPWPKPDFILTSSCCDTGHAKWYQVVQEFENIPQFGIDDPSSTYPAGGNMKQREDYLVGQFLDAIDWMEKITGKKYDDGKFIEAMRNFFKSEALWGEICLLNGAIPAPMDLKSALAMMPIPMIRRHEACAVEFLTELRDEVKDRIRDGIAGLATERFRMVTNAPPPWPFLKMFRYFENFGVVFVGTQVYVALCGAVDYKKDGRVVPAKTPEEQKGWLPMTGRENALRNYVRWMWEYKWPVSDFDWMGHGPKAKPLSMVSLYKHWKPNAVLLELNRGCPPMNMLLNLQKEKVLEAGLPVAFIETNFADTRDVDKAQLIDRLESFLENYGITKLS